MNKKATKRNNNNINKIIENKKGRIIMKATGVVRRIDDLGRVVIPKEIRKTLRIKEGDPLETTLEQLRIIADSLKMLALQV